MDRFKALIRAATGEFIWATILIPVLAISWLGFYTIARSIGIPPVFAAGMSAAFDGIALFAARIGLKHRRKGFSGYLARITVVAFAALGAFVQSFHAESATWIHAHSWIVWATAPVAACLAYELHLGWVHRKQLIRKGYQHPSAKSGFGPATWIRFPRETWKVHSSVLRARRDFIAQGNLARFKIEEDAQPKERRPEPRPEPRRAEPKPATRPVLRSVPDRPAPRPARTTPARRPRSENQAAAAWAKERGIKLGYRNNVPIAVLNEYRDWVRSATATG